MALAGSMEHYEEHYHYITITWSMALAGSMEHYMNMVMAGRTEQYMKHGDS